MAHLSLTVDETGSDRALLDVVRTQERAVRGAEVDQLCGVLDWALAHEVVDLDTAAFHVGFGEHGLSLAGPGAPLVAESAVTEVALALGRSTTAGASFLGDALEIRYRLPRLWQRVLALQVPVWRARRIAESTVGLCGDGADEVDRHLDAVCHSTSLAQLERLVAAAEARWDPEAAEERRRAAAEGRHVSVALSGRGGAQLDGTVDVAGRCDYADALALEHALRQRAADLATLGSTETLDVRRSVALGDLARHASGQGTLDLDAGESGSTDPLVRSTVVLHVHLSEATVSGRDADGDPVDAAEHSLGRTDSRHPGAGPVLAEQVRDWCGATGSVVVRPVLDLAKALHCESYEASARLDEQTEQRDRHCVFPHCTRPARLCDKDHVIAWPEGPTTSANQAPLCRRHHRHKTHLGWSYEALSPGYYLWRSPAGLRALRCPVGTFDLSPPPAATPRPREPRPAPPPPGPAPPVRRASTVATSVPAPDLVPAPF